MLSFQSIITLDAYIVKFSYFIFSGKCLVVKTSVGEDAVLPCSITHPGVDDGDLAVHWTRADLPSDQYVHYWWAGHMNAENQSPSYKGRTSLFKDEVKKGNMSLKLSRVKSSDEGNYTCIIPEFQKEFTIQLIGFGKTIHLCFEKLSRINVLHP